MYHGVLEQILRVRQEPEIQKPLPIYAEVSLLKVRIHQIKAVSQQDKAHQDIHRLIRGHGQIHRLLIIMVHPVNIQDHNLQVPVLREVIMPAVIQGHRALLQVRNHPVGQHQVLTRGVQAAVVPTQHQQEAAHPNRTQRLQEAAHPNRTLHQQEAALQVVHTLAEEVAAEAAVAVAAVADQDADVNKMR